MSSPKQRRAASAVAAVPISSQAQEAVEDTVEAVNAEQTQFSNGLKNPLLPNAGAAVDFFKSFTQSSMRSTQQLLKGWEDIRSAQLSSIQNFENDLQQVAELAQSAETVEDLTQIPARFAALAVQRWSEQVNRLLSVVVQAETTFMHTAQTEWTELAKRMPQSLPFPTLGNGNPVEADAVHNLSNYLESAQVAYTQVAGLWADMAQRHRPQ